MDADVLIEFMQRLVKLAQHKVILIPENLRVYLPSWLKLLVKTSLEKYARQTAMIYLPASSPELNPDVSLNLDLKAGVHSGSPVHSKKQLRRNATKHMRMQ